ncbi:hypothetical protein MVES1_001998 [Malassezia vespertilionis]|uniref:uncharacterized protein n=1 Tax=Malassezia vespertilionis TaxID=2020962 RepID=UPI0024B120B4|nr:uncharacterized protein MVES1_001998 [Malassezia vespertilionis]WFD06644.1 hypothetical protein MVES1_001998 [Malassezia vespertilionis]
MTADPARASGTLGSTSAQQSSNVTPRTTKPTQWQQRMQQRQRLQNLRSREREMTREKEDEAERKRLARKEREHKAAEKARLEAMAARRYDTPGGWDARKKSHISHYSVFV